MWIHSQVAVVFLRHYNELTLLRQVWCPLQTSAGQQSVPLVLNQGILPTHKHGQKARPEASRTAVGDPFVAIIRPVQ